MARGHLLSCAVIANWFNADLRAYALWSGLEPADFAVEAPECQSVFY